MTSKKQKRKNRYAFFLKHLAYRHVPIVSTCMLIIVTIFTWIITPQLPDHILRISFAIPSRYILNTSSQLEGRLFHTDQIWWQLPLIIAIPWLVTMIASLIILQKKKPPLPPIVTTLSQKEFEAEVQKRIDTRSLIGFSLNVFGTLIASYYGVLIITGLIFNKLGYTAEGAALLIGVIYVFCVVCIPVILYEIDKMKQKRKKKA